MKHQTGGLGGRVVTYLTFMPDCRRSGVRIPVGKKKFVYIYRRYLINAMLLSSIDKHRGTVSNQTNITKQPFNLNAQCYED